MLVPRRRIIASIRGVRDAGPDTFPLLSIRKSAANTENNRAHLGLRSRTVHPSRQAESQRRQLLAPEADDPSYEESTDLRIGRPQDHVEGACLGPQESS
jgi:hypothetical protein